MASAAVQTLKDIIPAIGDEDKHVRYEALKTLRDYTVRALGKLEPGVLAKYADDIVPRLDDEYWRVRDCAAQVLGKLEPGVLAEYADHIVPRLEDEYFFVRRSAVGALFKLELDVLSRYVGEFISYLGLDVSQISYLGLDVSQWMWDVLEKVPSVALVPCRYALQSFEPLESVNQPRVKMLRGRVWLARWRQLFWCWRFLWWWWGRAWMPGSRQAMAAASEFGRMQGVSPVEEEGEREVKRARVV